MIVLDRHTAPFFAPEFRSGAVEEELDIKGRVFQARMAPDIGGAARVVLQAKNNPRLGTFVTIRDERMLRAIAPNGALQTRTNSQPRKVPADLERLSFYSRSNCVIALSEKAKSWGWRKRNGKVIDLSGDTAVEFEFDFEHSQLPAKLDSYALRNFCSWSADENQSIVRHLAHRNYELKKTLAFLTMEESAKIRLCFGCNPAILLSFKALLRAALVVEMSMGTLTQFEKVNWFYWVSADESLETQLYRLDAEPPRLRSLKQRASAHWNIKRRFLNAPHPFARSTGRPRRTASRQAIEQWLKPIQVGPISAHEILEAQLQLREFERQYPR